MGEKLDYDSIDEVTDLENEGILTTSAEKLSKIERKRLKQYILDLRGVQKLEPKKHNCSPNKRDIISSREVVEMELRAIPEVLVQKDEIISAH